MLSIDSGFFFKTNHEKLANETRDVQVAHAGTAFLSP